MKIESEYAPSRYAEVSNGCIATITRISSERFNRKAIPSKTMFWLEKATDRIKREQDEFDKTNTRR